MKLWAIKYMLDNVRKGFPHLDQSTVEMLLPSKCNLEELRLVTSCGIETTVMFVDKEPLFFEFSGNFVPTVYGIWKAELLKFVYTWRQVFDKLLGGADLMLPGVCDHDNSIEKMKELKKGDLCALGVVGNRSAVGVMVSLLSWSEMQASHMKGKGFKVLHLCGDKLWEMGSRFDSLSDYPVLSSPSPKSSDQQSSDKPINTEQVCEEETIAGKITGSCDAGADSEKDMDELLKECFYMSLKDVLERATLPLLTSTFYSSFMLPQSSDLDVKKSSFKKVSRFLHSMSEMGVIVVEEVSKGVTSITRINLKHPLVKGFSPVLLTQTRADDGMISSPEIVKEITVAELYTPSIKLMPVFQCSGHGKSSLLSSAQVKEAIHYYVKLNNLQSAENPSVVMLDAVLCDGLQQKAKFYCTELTFKDLLDRVLINMKPSHRISCRGSDPIVRKGHLQPVLMTMMQRAGNKKVTIVENVELYGIPAHKLAQTAQRIAAASATVEHSSGSPVVLVQGTPVNTLCGILKDEYGLSKKFIEVIDKVKKSTKSSGRR